MPPPPAAAPEAAANHGEPPLPSDLPSDLAAWKGRRVVVRNLAQHPQLNGRLATVLKPSKPPHLGRLDVRLLMPEGDASLGPKMALKPENLALQAD